MDLSQVVGWLNDSVVKTVLLIAGGALLKKWPSFVSKAVPTALLGASGLVALLNGLFPSIGPAGTSPAGFVAGSFAGVQVYAASSGGAKAISWLWNTLIPAAVAVGLHSGPKNTREWIKLGVGFLWPGGSPPTQKR